MSERDSKAEFWNSFLRAVEVEPRTARSIRGASGFEHPLVSVGVDDKRERVIIISGEGDARSATLAHGDIQANMPSLKVMMARPVVIDLGETARIFSEIIGRVSIGQKDLEWFSQNKKRNQELINAAVERYRDRIEAVTSVPFSAAALNLVAVWKDIIQQLSLIEVEASPSEQKEQGEAAQEPAPTFHLRKLIALDPAAVDRSLGVCSIPIYEFSASDVEKFQAGSDLDAVRHILKQRDIFQYFFPAPDHLALGLAEPGQRSASQILSDLVKTPEVGHPFGKFEVFGSKLELNEVVDSLQERGLLVEGEAGIEITQDGKQLRAQVRFRPREGLLARLANILSVKIDLNLKDLFK